MGSNITEFTLKDSRPAEKIAHPSTKCALAAIQSLSDRHFTHIMDIGCGSGLLTMVTAQIWPDATIIGSDISAQAIQDATENIEAGEASHRIHLVQAEGFQHSTIEDNAPYDLIVSNLLAETHIKQALPIKKHLTMDGIAILSGILMWREQQVIEAYSAAGMHIETRFADGEWRALMVINSTH